MTQFPAYKVKNPYRHTQQGEATEEMVFIFIEAYVTNVR